MKDIWTVSELNEGIKDLLDEHFGFLWVEGEVSNLRRPASGHVYFTLKDAKSQIRAVIFHAPYARKAFDQNLTAGFDLEDGLHITCRARLTVYSPRGEYQLIIDRVEPRGLGALQKAYEQLKARLQAEGLFDAVHKKEIPYLPGRIGVITSPTGAVIRDILHITARRFPSVHIVVASVRVQGFEAPDEIVQAIADMNRITDVDLIILGRGGGSFEDLYPFNTEGVARAIFASQIPIISAIGHETDVTISDFVADLRAPTPSAAAELAVPLRDSLLDNLASLSKRLLNLPRQGIGHRRDQVEDLRKHLRDPRRILEDRRLRLDYALDRMQSNLSHDLGRRRYLCERLETRLHHVDPSIAIQKKQFILDYFRKDMTIAMKNVMENFRGKLLSRQTALQALNPLAVLQRGYSLTTKVPEGWIVKEAGGLVLGNDVQVRLARGSFRARVTELREEE
jgi:exodeoxyribonuclease VII large subunit